MGLALSEWECCCLGPDHRADVLGCRRPWEELLALSLGPKNKYTSLGGQGPRKFSLALVANWTFQIYQGFFTYKGKRVC